MKSDYCWNEEGGALLPFRRSKSFESVWGCVGAESEVPGDFSNGSQKKLVLYINGIIVEGRGSFHNYDFSELKLCENKNGKPGRWDFW